MAFGVMMVTGVLLEEDHVGWWIVTKQTNIIVSCVSLPTRAYCTCVKMYPVCVCGVCGVFGVCVCVCVCVCQVRHRCVSLAHDHGQRVDQPDRGGAVWKWRGGGGEDGRKGHCVCVCVCV